MAGLCDSLFRFLNVSKEPAVHLHLCEEIHLQPEPYQAVPLGTCGVCSSRDPPARGVGSGHSSMQLIYSGGTGG